MERKPARSQWYFIVLMFLFLFFQQWMGFLVEPITNVYNQTASLIDRWVTFTLPFDVIFMMLFFLIWGYLFDRHSRKQLLTLGGFLWGVSAWLMGLAPSFTTFNISSSVSGAALACHSGIYAMTGDIFKPTNRGKIYGFFLLAQPLAIVIAEVNPGVINEPFGWRAVLVFFGAIGFLFTLLIHLFIKDPKRGANEPALAGIQLTGTYLLEWDIVVETLKKPSLMLVYALIFFGTIPVIVLFNGSTEFINTVIGLPLEIISVSLIPSMLGLLLGYPFGGIMGDLLFKFWKSGRLVSCMLGFVFPPILLFYAFQGLDAPGQTFFGYIILVSFFMALVIPNLIATIMDVALPEIRATASALGLLHQSISFIIAPRLLSFVRGYLPIGNALLLICISIWILCIILCVGLFVYVPKDIENLRRHMAYRSHLEARLKYAS